MSREKWDRHAVTDICLTVMNDSAFVDRVMKPIRASLVKHWRAGTYDPDLAMIHYKRAQLEARKEYDRQWGTRFGVRGGMTRTETNELAKALFVEEQWVIQDLEVVS